MNTSTHPVAPEEVMAFTDGELTGVWNEFVAKHIAECPECGEAAAEFRKSSQGLGAWQMEGAIAGTPRKVSPYTAKLPAGADKTDVGSR
jgi:anti-sigma factor RsiW